jgi:hypothetical protein
MWTTQHKIRELPADYGQWGILCALVFATLMVASIVMTMLGAPAFADVSPILGDASAGSRIDDSHIQLAQADLPSGIGSLNDYMHQGGDGPSSGAVPPPAYSPQAAPPPSFYPQTVPSQEWNNQYLNPDAARDALIGAAVVGALTVGLWAYQQHEMHQAQQRARKRFYVPRRAYR